MPKFRKKPVVIEAIQWDGDSWDTIHQIIQMDSGRKILLDIDDSLSIETLEGTMKANIGDWVIKGVKGEVYPCKPDIFEETYEPVEE